MKKIINTFMLMLTAVICISFGNKITANATGEANPRLLVESYWLTDDDEITPGEEFELNLRIRNTSIYYDTYSVVVTVTDDSGNDIPYFYPVYGDSNQVYIERVYSRNSWDISLKLKAADTIDINTIPMLVTITYNDNYFIEKQKNEAGINIPVKANGDLKITSCSVPKSASVGAKARISAVYENTGINSLNNVVMNVEYGNGLLAQNELYSVQGGSSGSTSEVYIDCYEAGYLPVTVSFTYEGADGDEYTTESMDYVITVEETEETNDVEIVGNSVNVLTFVLLAAIVIVAIGILIILKNRRK